MAWSLFACVPSPVGVDEGGVHLQLRYEGDVARVADDHLEEQLAMAQLVQPSTFSGCSPHGVRPTATAYAMSTPPARRMPTRCAKSCTMRQRALQRLPRLGTELQTPGRRPRRWPERFAILCHVRRPGHADSGGKHNGHASCRFADMGPVLEVIGFTLPAVAVAAAAGAIAGWRPPGQRLTSAIQHLAAGIVFAAAALELLPKERHAAAVPVALGFGIGLVLMLGLRVLANRLEARDAGGRLPAGLIVVTGIDLLVDGIVLGIGFAAGEQTGVLLAAALTLEVLFVSLAVGAAMSQGSAGQLGTLLMPPALALGLLASAALARLFLGDLGPFAFALLLGAGTVALLYLVVEELLVEAHEVPETPWATAAFFMGFLLFLLLEMYVEG